MIVCKLNDKYCFNIKAYFLEKIVMTIKEQLFQKIREQKQGWAFSATDFIQDFKRGDIDVALKDNLICLYVLKIH